jgi:hypothetical protein
MCDLGAGGVAVATFFLQATPELASAIVAIIVRILALISSGFPPKLLISSWDRSRYKAILLRQYVRL